MILRPATALLCIELLLANLTACGGNRVALPDIQPLSQVFLPLQDELNKSYGTLFEAAPKPEYSDGRRTRSATTGMALLAKKGLLSRNYELKLVHN